MDPPPMEMDVCVCGGGGGFFLTCEDFGGRLDHSFDPRLRFFKVEISSRILIPLFRPGSVHCSLVS